MAEKPKKDILFVCRDCGKEYSADDVMIVDAEPISRDRTPIADNKCPACGGILDLRFPESGTE
jgi:DNA-directed RNA polymerase subunit RPC12/RpoP